jgi:hypothetical protein
MENRRNRLDLMKPVEKAIHDAMQELEKIGADVRLTQATIHLMDAKKLVSDWLDEQEENATTQGDDSDKPPVGPKP